MGSAYGYRLLERLVGPADQGDWPELEDENARALLLSCVHHANDMSYCHEVRAISLSETPDAEHADFTREAAGPWLLAKVPWTTAEHRISAINADRSSAQTFKLSSGTACLVIERNLQNRNVVTHVRLTHPGIAHQLVAKHTPFD
nr:UTRA domain-containing protein [Agrobacterium vitis]